MARIMTKKEFEELRCGDVVYHTLLAREYLVLGRPSKAVIPCVTACECGTSNKCLLSASESLVLVQALRDVESVHTERKVHNGNGYEERRYYSTQTCKEKDEQIPCQQVSVERGSDPLSITIYEGCVQGIPGNSSCDTDNG